MMIRPCDLENSLVAGEVSPIFALETLRKNTQMEILDHIEAKFGFSRSIALNDENSQYEY